MRSSQNPNPRPSSRPARVRRIAAAAAIASACAASLAAIAIASAGAPTVKATHNAKLGRIVVDAHGRTIYVLSPETARHLLCKTRECFEVWPPLTVPSRKTMLKAGAGVRGRLAILRRSNGMLQLTLNGMPLYHFSGDGRKGEAKGQHIHSFGGVWHVIRARHGASMRWSGTATSSSMSATSSEEAATSSTSSPAATTTSTSSTATTTATTTTSTSTYKYPPY
jgi:predicted lipoprotein with Yx(FWY)xxD motif